MTDAELERILDRRVQAALRIDTRYRLAASGDEQQLVENLIEVEQEARIYLEARSTPASLQYAGRIAELKRLHVELSAELDALKVPA